MNDDELKTLMCDLKEKVSAGDVITRVEGVLTKDRMQGRVGSLHSIPSCKAHVLKNGYKEWFTVFAVASLYFTHFTNGLAHACPVQLHPRSCAPFVTGFGRLQSFVTWLNKVPVCNPLFQASTGFEMQTFCHKAQ
eukprot:1147849-Pelagomonas_calceolata.AAC.7